jgi:hypothetical protein
VNRAITPSELRELADRIDDSEASAALLDAADQIVQLNTEVSGYRRHHGRHPQGKNSPVVIASISSQDSEESIEFISGDDDQ